MGEERPVCLRCASPVRAWHRNCAAVALLVSCVTVLFAQDKADKPTVFEGKSVLESHGGCSSDTNCHSEGVVLTQNAYAF